MSALIVVSRLPLEFKRFWLVNENAVVDMCLKPPGYEVDVRVVSEIRRFVEAWRGFRSLKNEIAKGHIRVEGSPANRQALPSWLLGSSLTEESRRKPGRERRVSSRGGVA